MSVDPSPRRLKSSRVSALGLLLGPLQRAAFLVVADLGGDHVEDPPAEPGQVGGSELVGVLDQPLLGQLPDLDADVGGQRRRGR